MDIQQKVNQVLGGTTLMLVNTRVYRKWARLNRKVLQLTLPATSEHFDEYIEVMFQGLRDIKLCGRVLAKTQLAADDLGDRVMGSMDIDIHLWMEKAEQIKNILKY